MGAGTDRSSIVAAPGLRAAVAHHGIGAGWIPRPRLVDALIMAEGARLVLLDAPVGYGKSVVLSQWQQAEGDRRRFARLSLERADSDPTRLLSHLVAAIGRVVPDIGESLTSTLRGQGRVVLPGIERLLQELDSASAGLVIALDDLHVLRGEKIRAVMKRLLEGLPSTVQLAVASRADPPLPLGRLRATGEMVELRAADLRFDRDEAGALLGTSGIDLRPDDVADLVERTEGWPAGLYLATLSLRDEPDPSGFVRRFAGTHRHVADYLSEEVLQRLPVGTADFLMRTSVLRRMRADLCDAVVAGSGSQAMLEDLERSNLFVVPLDDRREWYRYHHLFGEMLRAHLSRSHPTLAPELHRRASAWFEAEDLPEEAIEHALASGEGRLAGDLIARHWFGLFLQGRLETIAHWLADVGDDVIAASPPLALAAAWVSALTGLPERMERWLATVERAQDVGPSTDGSASLRSGASIVRGLFGFRGLRARLADLERAQGLEPADSPWQPYLWWGRGHVALLSGEPTEAVRLLDECLRVADPADPVVQMIALAEMSVARSELADGEAALELAQRAASIAHASGLETDTRASGVSLALGTALAAAGHLERGAEALEHGLELRVSPGRLSPWPTLEILAALIPVRLTQGDREEAAMLLARAHEILSQLEDAGDLPRRFAAAERQLSRSGRQVGFGEALTEREMTILQLLPTHLSQRQIGAQMYLSLNTVKTHSRAIYRKLGVTSRSDAVARARELHLI